MPARLTVSDFVLDQGKISSEKQYRFHKTIIRRSREEAMNDTLDGIASTAHSLKPVKWNVDKIHAALCILSSACITAGLIAWGVYAIL
jgi:hypothetical protein